MEFLLRSTPKEGSESKTVDHKKANHKKTMNERHMEDLGHVMIANIIGWIPTIVEFETCVRVAGLLLAATYTAIKIVQSLKQK
jgi:hypothetical protein